MRTILFAAAFLLLACSASSCSSARECSREDDYTIEYFTGGGFTGMENGMTIECSGRVIVWERKVNGPREATDSLLLSSSTRKKFDAMMSDAGIFEYSLKKVSNHTATLMLTKLDKHTVIAYNSSELPADLPASVRAILSEIRTIHK